MPVFCFLDETFLIKNLLQCEFFPYNLKMCQEVTIKRKINEAQWQDTGGQQ